MTLTDKAYLTLYDDDGTEAIFEFNIGLEPTSELDKTYLMGERGQYIREIINNTPFTGEFGDANDRRTGVWIDGGAGSWTETVSFETGMEDDDIQWGDGSGGVGQSNVTATDASGPGVKPQSREDVLTFWLSKTVTDSRNQGRLYTREWTDGRFEGSSGAMNGPMPVAVIDSNVTADLNEPTSLSGTLTVQHIALFADGEIPDWVPDNAVNYFQKAAELLNQVPDA